MTKKAFIKKAVWAALAVILVPLTVIFTAIYALEAYSRLPFLEQSKTWGSIVSELEKKLTPKELDALTMEKLSIEINSLDIVRQQDNYAPSIADELYTKLVQLLREQSKERLITKKQRDTCERLVEMAASIQQWRRANDEYTYDDFVRTQKEPDPIVEAFARKIYKVPLRVPPLAVGLNFKEYCLNSYEEINEKEDAF